MGYPAFQAGYPIFHRQFFRQCQVSSRRFRGSSPSHIPLSQHVEHAPGGQPQGRDHRQSHEAQGHEGVNAPGHAQPEGLVLGGLQGAVHHHQAVVGHDARDGQGHLAQDLAAVHYGDAAAILHNPVGGGGHVLLGGSHHDDVVAVVADGGGHGAMPEAVALDIAQADVVGVLMPLDDGDFQDVLLQVDVVGIARVLGHDLAGHHADDGVGALVGEVGGGQRGHMEGVVGPA